MTRMEIAQLLTIIAARYPTSRLWEAELDALIAAWHLTLSDVDYQAAETALTRWFRSEKWAPDPSELRDAVAGELLGLPDVESAWSVARQEVARWYPGHAYQSAAPAPVMRAIKAIGGLHALKLSERPDRDREAFQRAYSVERKRAVESAVLDRVAIAEPDRHALSEGSA